MANDMIVITGKENIEAYRILALRKRLELEIKGIRFRISTCAAIKRQFGWKGQRKTILKKLNEYIEKNILPKE